MTDDFSIESHAMPETLPGRVAMADWLTTLRRGLSMRCPSCGDGPLFDGYLRVRPTCPHCDAPLGRVPCDDAPPYLTLLISLHIIALLAILMDRHGAFSSSTLLAILLPLTLVLILLLLRPIKGATLAVMLKVNLLRPDGSGEADGGLNA